MKDALKQKMARARELDPGAKEQLILQYSPLIKYIAHRIASRLPNHVDMDDLINVGVLGLIDAVDRFDPHREIKFKTYAEFRIKGTILDHLRSLDWVPRSVRQKANILEETYSAFERRLGRPATDEEMASELGLKVEDYYHLIQQASTIPLVSLDEVLGLTSAGEKKKIVENIAASMESDPIELLGLEELKKLIAEAIDALPEKERLVVSLYYYEELTMKEIGAVLDITESRVSQIHAKAILRLRSKIKKLFREEAPPIDDQGN